MSDLPAGALDYHAVVTEYFLGLRGAGLLVSPLDEELVREWERRGVPVAVVCRGLRGGLEESAERRGPGAPAPRSIRALRFSVEDEWRAYQLGRVGDAPPPPAEAAAAEARLAAARAGARRRRARRRRRRSAMATVPPGGRSRPRRTHPGSPLERVEAALAAADARLLSAWLAGLPRAGAERARAARCRLLAGPRPRGASRPAHRAALRAHLLDSARAGGAHLPAGFGVDSASPWPPPRTAPAPSAAAPAASWSRSWAPPPGRAGAPARRPARAAARPATRSCRRAARWSRRCAAAGTSTSGSPSSTRSASRPRWPARRSSRSRAGRRTTRARGRWPRTSPGSSARDAPTKGYLLYGRPGRRQDAPPRGDAPLARAREGRGRAVRRVHAAPLGDQGGLRREPQPHGDPAAAAVGAGARHRRAGQGARHRVGALDARRAHQPALQLRPRDALRHELLPRAAPARRGARRACTPARASSSATPRRSRSAQRVGDRIYSRLNEMCSFVKLDPGHDLRKDRHGAGSGGFWRQSAAPLPHSSRARRVATQSAPRAARGRRPSAPRRRSTPSPAAPR